MNNETQQKEATMVGEPRTMVREPLRDRWLTLVLLALGAHQCAACSSDSSQSAGAQSPLLDGGGSGGGSTDGVASSDDTTDATSLDGGSDTAPSVCTPVPPALFIEDVVYGEDRFVAVGEIDELDAVSCVTHTSGVIYTSTDGRSWTLATERPSSVFDSIAYGNGIFLITGWGAASISGPRLLIRSDGNTFDTLVEPPTTVDGVLAFGSTPVVFGNGMFMMGADPQTVLTTTDGVTFQLQALPAPRAIDLPFGAGLAFGAGHFAFGNSSGFLYVSEGGTTWTPHDVNGETNYALTTVRAAGDALVVGSSHECCDGEAGLQRFGRASSYDGVSWIFVDGGNQNVPIPEFVTDDICVSIFPTSFPRSDGSTMECASIDDALRNLIDQVRARAYGAGTYVIGGRLGIVTSNDLVHWTRTLEL